MLQTLTAEQKTGDSTLPLPAEALKTTLSSFEKLSLLPDKAYRAMEVAPRPNASLSDFSAVLERDPLLAMGILKLANSPLYRIGWPIDSLDMAVLHWAYASVKT